jgi:hypothetical protein
MARSKPCAVCGKWFYPNARQGDRQHTCGAAGCRKAWHQRACRRWRKAHPDDEKEIRLQRRLVRDRSPGPPGHLGDPLTSIDWDLARKRVGVEASVLVAVTGQVLLQAVRDAIPVQVFGNGEVMRKFRPLAGRDAISSQAFENRRLPAKS